MPKAASLRNLRPWSPGQSGNPKGRPRAPRFTERDQHVILAALAGALGAGTQRAGVKAMRTVLTNPPNRAQSDGVLRQVDWQTRSVPRAVGRQDARQRGRVAPSDDHLEHELWPEEAVGCEAVIRRAEPDLNGRAWF